MNCPPHYSKMVSKTTATSSVEKPPSRVRATIASLFLSPWDLPGIYCKPVRWGIKKLWRKNCWQFPLSFCYLFLPLLPFSFPRLQHKMAEEVIFYPRLSIQDGSFIWAKRALCSSRLVMLAALLKQQAKQFVFRPISYTYLQTFCWYEVS